MDRAVYTLEDQRRMARATNYFAWQARLALPHLGRRVLEIGCGIGNFTQLLLDRECVIALDSEPACIDELRARFGDQPNLCAMTGDAADDLSPLRPQGLDSCVCLNVLEHIENDSRILSNLASVLSPGGTVVLIVPAFNALYGRIDRNLGHYRRYTQASLERLATAADLAVVQSRYMNVPGFFAWWLNARVFRREAQSASQIEFFDRLIVPVISRAERVISPPFGQSLFAVMRTLK